MIDKKIILAVIGVVIILGLFIFAFSSFNIDSTDNTTTSDKGDTKELNLGSSDNNTPAEESNETRESQEKSLIPQGA